MRSTRLFLALASLLATPLDAQVIDLTVHNTGLAIGDKPLMNGIRLNFRDRQLERINGINATIWSPYSPAKGTVNGVALGIPVTGAGQINGVGIAVVGLGVENTFRGIGIAPIGVGGGNDMAGIFVGGIGVGGGRRLEGLSIGGIGVGSGGSLRGIQIGGIGVGGGGDVTGISIGGIGVGGGGNVTGLAIAAIGVGGAGDFTGIGIGGIGVGTGGNATGLMIGGVGVGSGGTVRGLAIGGVGVGAPRLNGVALSLIGAGGVDVKAIVIAGAYFKVDEKGRFDGGSLSAVNNVSGAQHGLTIGLWNYARELHGAQFGLINISDNDGKRRVFPLLSVR
jgi:hypothetical protein